MNTNSTNLQNESDLPPEEKKKTSPVVTLVYLKVRRGHKIPADLKLTYPENPLSMYKHTVYRPTQATVDEPDDWVSTVAYRRWINKIREQIG